MPPSSKSPAASTSLPKNWPPSLPYLTTQAHSASLTTTHLTALRTRPVSLSSSSSSASPETDCIPAHTPRGPCPLVKITPIAASSTHPAAGQAGLFATRDLKPGTFIIQYLGEVHASAVPGSTTADSAAADGAPAPSASASASASDSQKADPHASSDYDLSLDRFHGLAIDAATRGNEARFINDYRGVPGRDGRKANAEFREVWDEARGERGMGVWVLGAGKGASSGKSAAAAKSGAKGRSAGVGKEGKGGKVDAKGNVKGGIKKGEEILVSYGRGFWGARREEEDGQWEGQDETTTQS